MTTAERILIRWLAATSAGVTAANAALVAYGDLISTTVIVVLAVVGAVLAAMVAALTTDTGKVALGLKHRE